MLVFLVFFLVYDIYIFFYKTTFRIGSEQDGSTHKKWTMTFITFENKFFIHVMVSHEQRWTMAFENVQRFVEFVCTFCFVMMDLTLEENLCVFFVSYVLYKRSFPWEMLSWRNFPLLKRLSFEMGKFIQFLLKSKKAVLNKPRLKRVAELKTAIVHLVFLVGCLFPFHY